MKPKEFLAWLEDKCPSNKAISHAIKYIPVVGTLLMVIHLSLLILGLYEAVTVTLAGILSMVLLILLSFKFHFCRLHKALIIYMCLMAVCICIQKYNGFGMALTAFRIGMLIIGIVLVALMVVKLVKGDECCDK